MSMPGSGIGGNIGGPLQFSQAEREATAWTLINKQQLGIVKDIIDVPLPQVGGNIWQYSTDTNQPTLPHFEMIRTTGEDAKIDESWKENFDQLMNQLPPKLKARIQKEFAKTFEFRDANFTVLEQTLTALAKGLAWMKKAEQPITPNTTQEEKLIHNQSLGRIALRGIIKHSQAQLEGAKSFLSQVGPNDPNHDKLQYFTKESGNLQHRMNEFLEILANPNETLPAQEQMDQLSADIGKLYKEFTTISQGNNLQIMGTMLETMEGVAQALSMTPTSPSLFLGLKTALKGIFKSESEAGIFGENIEALLKALQSGMGETLMKKLGSAKLKMLLMMLMSAFGGLGSLASILSDEGTGRFHAEDEQAEAEGKKFSFLLIMELIESTELMKILLGIICKACGQTEPNQDMSAELLELPALLFMTVIAGKGKMEKTTPLIDELTPRLQKKTNKTEKFVKDAFPYGENDNPNAKKLRIALQQGLIALENNDSEGFFHVLEGMLEQMNGSKEGLKKDLVEIKKFATLFKHSFGAGLASETKVNPSIIHSA